MIDDDEVWDTAHIEDLWIFDKLILAKKLGYQCGPAGGWTPESKNYIIRPCVNAVGMSKGAYIDHIEKNTDTDYLPAGFFWCEIFEGRHLSVDYDFGIQGLTTEGFRNTDDPLWKFNRWTRVDDKVEYPEILHKLVGKYPTINCEFIGGNLIEVHLRANEEMGDYDEIIPVWKDDPNNILGIIHAKNILSNLDNEGKIDLKKIKEGIIQPWFIPETTKVKDQLNEFIKRKEKIAFVVDEYGELMGLISLEDIIEEIVGNIFDEKDFSTIGIRRVNHNQYRIRGDVNIRDINRELDLNLPENDASTLAGYIIFKTEALPEVGQTFKFNNIVYEILNKNKNQITQIKVVLDKNTKH